MVTGHHQQMQKLFSAQTEKTNTKYSHTLIHSFCRRIFDKQYARYDLSALECPPLSNDGKLVVHLLSKIKTSICVVAYTYYLLT